MTFKNWRDTFIKEKGLDTGLTLLADGPSGVNHIPCQVVVEHMYVAPKHEQEQIKNVIVQIDFANGDVMDFFKHLAKAIAR